MTDQGWMIDDGTCESCWLGSCWGCTKPVESYGDGQSDPRITLVCCCNEGYHVGYLDLPEEVER